MTRISFGRSPDGGPARCAPLSAITPPAMRTPPRTSLCAAGSTSLALKSKVCGRAAFLPSSRIRQMPRERFENRHAHRNPHLDLLAHERLRPVGNIGGDLDASVHRAWMHDESVGLRERELLAIEPEIPEIFAHRGHEGAAHSLAL